MLGLLAPTSGSITVEGVDVVAHPRAVSRFSGYMPQTRIAMRNLEVERALTVTGRLRGQSEPTARAQTNALIERLELGEHRAKYMDRLSGGLMRVAAFGMALMGDPRLIVLDEPTNELDPLRRRMVWEIIRDLKRERPVTCVLVTHNVLEAERVVDRVAMIDGGRVVAVGTPGALKAQLGDEVRLEVVLVGAAKWARGRAVLLRLLLDYLCVCCSLGRGVHRRAAAGLPVLRGAVLGSARQPAANLGQVGAHDPHPTQRSRPASPW